MTLLSPHAMIWIATATLLAACGQSAPPPASPPALRLPEKTVALELIGREQIFDGVLEAVNQATVSAQASGQIIMLPADVGQPVRAGDVVARLQDTEQQARLRQADASLADAQARQTEADKAWQRVQDVFQKKLVAGAQMDRATAEHDAAAAQMAAAAAARTQAVEQLAHTVVRAPFAGVITNRAVHVGDAVMPGQPLLDIQGGNATRAVVDVPQPVADTLRSARSATVIFPDGSRSAASGVTVFPNADPLTHTFRVRVDLPGNRQAGGHAGQLIRVAFALDSQSGIALSPDCLVWQGEVAGVYVEEGNRVEFRAIRPGRTLADGRIHVLAGLFAGERLVTRPDLATAWLAQERESAHE